MSMMFPRAVRDGLQDVLAGTVHPAEGDEGPPQVVTTPRTQPEPCEILQQLVAAVVLGAHRGLPRRNEQVVGLRRTAHQTDRTQPTVRHFASTAARVG